MSELFERSDAELIKVILAPSAPQATVASHELVRRYDNVVMKIALCILRNESDAADACQSTFCHLFSKALKRYDHERPFEDYLKAVARNRCLDYLRSRNRWSLNKQSQLLELDQLVAKSAVDPRTEVEIEETRRLLRQSVRALPKSQREVMEGRLAGLKHVEIARQLGKTPEAVRQLSSRAERRLREIVSRYLENGEHNQDER